MDKFAMAESKAGSSCDETGIRVATLPLLNARKTRRARSKHRRAAKIMPE